MEVVPLDSADAVASLAADTVERLVRARAGAVLGLATGSTPLATYRELARRHQDGVGPSYAGITCVLLDEYVGLPAGHPQGYRATIARELTDALGIPSERVHGPDPDDPQHAGAAYEALLGELGGVDLQVLGIGTDGHLAFNEPGSSLGSRTRVKTLTARTRADNARFFGSADAGAPARAHPGPRHHPRRPAPAAAGDGGGQGGGRRGRRRGPAHRVLPRLGAAAARARHGAARPCLASALWR